MPPTRGHLRPTATSRRLQHSARQVCGWPSQVWGSSWPNGPVVRTSSRRLVGLPLAFALTLLATFALTILARALALVLPAVLQEVPKFSRTCCTSCHRAAVARLSPSEMCSSHWLHGAPGKPLTLPPSYARHPQALVERGPTSGISLNSTTSASRALCPSLGSGRSPHASHLRSSLPRPVHTAPDRAHTPRASRALIPKSRIGAGSRVALPSLT